jgi:hypothetical protein
VKLASSEIESKARTDLIELQFFSVSKSLVDDRNLKLFHSELGSCQSSKHNDSIHLLNVDLLVLLSREKVNEEVLNLL